ncbi:hypothetical protein XENOCAPTIV_002522 [Xenoophorus captivus]|uniref:Regulation of nuclear pre-mRNA domain containing 2a n=1 Tax=Xenoophorus captivus TaxID=1517983 RepID=A0ABV0RF36_9TELE
MQYKEVKIVANAYQTFANRVSHLKRKLDALKATLPDLDESPIPSPTADAPSPTGSESPFHELELAHPDPDLDGSAMDDDAEPPAPSPLSSLGASPKHDEAIGENDNREVEDMELSEEEMDSGGIIGRQFTGEPPLQGGCTTPLLSPNTVPDPFTPGKITSSSSSASAASSQSIALSFPAPVLSSSKSAAQQNSQAAPKTSNKASALVQALHRDMDLSTDPEPFISSSLESKIHSFLQGNPAFSAFDQSFPTNASVRGERFSPVTGTDNQEGTPVRDEGGGTPTQDEIMDKAVAVPFGSSNNQSSVNEAAKTAPVAFENNKQKNPNNPQHPAPLLQGFAQNGQIFQPFPFGKPEMLESGIPAPASHYQHVAMHPGGPAFGEGVPGSASSSQTVEGFQRANEQSWFGDAHPEGSSQQPSGYNMLVPGVRENKATGLFPYQTEQTREHHEFVSQQGPSAASNFFRCSLPPVPKVPPPPPSFDPPVTSPAGGLMNPPQQEAVHNTAAGGGVGGRGDSLISSMVVHDHQHTSSLHPDDLFHDPHRPQQHQEFHPHPDDMRYHGDLGQPDAHFLQDDPYYPPDDPYFRPGSPPHPYPRGRGHFSPPLSPSRDPYFTHEQHNPPPPRQYAPRRPPPPRHEMRHPGQRPPPPRPPHLARHPHPRGPPRPPFPRFNGPDPRFRGKRPGPRGGGPMFPPKRPFLPPRY